MNIKMFVISLSLVSFGAQALIINENNPPEYQSFKSNYSDMIELANKSRLPHRVFYTSPSTGKNALWFDAVKHGDLNEVKKMLANGQNIEAKDTGSLEQTALGWAAFIGDEEMVDYLISQGASLWATDRGDVYNVFKSAVLGNNVNVVKKIHDLMRSDIELNNQRVESDGETFIMIAASNNRLDTVRYLISKGADVNLVTTTQDKSLFSYNHSALSYACQNNLKDMQRLLIRNGAINHITGTKSCH
ncbi:ankyrin repeat domain-containing protein [Proteus sp. ZN5]|uniref:ankyrin repeat domain-containing protein n=1 Tax=Proteus sp. ZN5 TaxID=2697019 RepID=UPI0019D02842|nr:ankyrin repeat domain-containing protein [Proteus sp. ZN5]